MAVEWKTNYPGEGRELESIVFDCDIMEAVGIGYRESQAMLFDSSIWKRVEVSAREAHPRGFRVTVRYAEANYRQRNDWEIVLEV